MNLYLISQTWNSNYDTYDSAVVAAKTEDDARVIHPGGPTGRSDTWTESQRVSVTLIGKAIPGTAAGSVICASFNAG